MNDSNVVQGFMKVVGMTAGHTLDTYVKTFNKHMPELVGNEFEKDGALETFLHHKMLEVVLSRLLKDPKISLSKVLVSALKEASEAGHPEETTKMVSRLSDVLSADAVLMFNEHDAGPFSAMELGYFGPDITGKDGEPKIDASLEKDGMLVTMASSIVRYAQTLATDISKNLKHSKLSTYSSTRPRTEERVH